MSADTVSTSIRAALAERLVLPQSVETVSVIGEFPWLQSIRIAIDGAVVREAELPQKPLAVVSRAIGFSVESFELSGRPVIFQKAKLNLGITATGLAFDFGRDADDRLQLVPTHAKSGTIDGQISDDDLEIALLAAATAGAKEYGVTVQDVHAVLVSNGPKSVSADIRVKAKKLMMTGVITLRGRVDISDDLVATVSNVGCTGEGIVGSTVAAIIQKKIQAYEGTRTGLTQFCVGDVQLRDVEIYVDDGVRVSAKFSTAM